MASARMHGHNIIALVVAVAVSFVHGSFTGGLQLWQIEVTSSGTVSWPLRGIATYEIGHNARHFQLRCVATINDGSDLTWSKAGSNIQRTQSVVSNGIQLDLANPVLDDAGTYICQDSSNSSIRATVVLTTDNPAVLASNINQHAMQGERVVITFFTSGLPTPTEENITWFHNDVELTSGLEEGRTQLVIDNVQPMNGGSYTFRVGTTSGTASATTQLTVTELPQPSMTTVASLQPTSVEIHTQPSSILPTLPNSCSQHSTVFIQQLCPTPTTACSCIPLSSSSSSPSFSSPSSSSSVATFSLITTHTPVMSSSVDGNIVSIHVAALVVPAVAVSFLILLIVLLISIIVVMVIKYRKIKTELRQLKMEPGAYKEAPSSSDNSNGYTCTNKLFSSNINS